MITGPEIVVLLLIGSAITLFVWDRLPPDLVAMGLLLILVFGGLLDIDEALVGFANPALLTLAGLFVLSEGVIRAGVVGYIGQLIAVTARGNLRLVVFITLLVVAVCSAFLNNTPVVVLFIPIVLGLAERYEFSPSKLLIPISYISILGGTCTLLGTSTNILINSFAGGQAGIAFEPLTMFEFLPLGLVFGGIGLVYVGLLGFRLLPDRRTVAAMPSSSELTEYVTEIRIRPGSRSVGRSVRDAILKRHPQLKVVELIRGEGITWGPTDEVLAAGDILIVMGDKSRVAALRQRRDLEMMLESGQTDDVRVAETTLAEAVLPPKSQLIGRTLEAIHFRKRFGVAVIAIQRHGYHFRDIAGIRLRVGDLLLVQGETETIHNLRVRRDLLLLEGAGEPVVMRRRAPLSALIFLAVVVLAALGVWPIAQLAIAGAFLMILTRCLTTQHAYRAVSWDILVLIAGMIALGKAMEHTGLSRTMAGWIELATVGLNDDVRPYFVLATFYLLINATSNVLSNNATALLFVPIVLETAAALGVDNRPFLFCVAFASSAAFCLPIGYQTHLLVYGPGGYRARDFVRFGTPLSIILWLVASVLLPIFWPF